MADSSRWAGTRRAHGVTVITIVLAVLCVGFSQSARAARLNFTGVPSPPQWALRSRVHFARSPGARGNSGKHPRGDLEARCEPAYCALPPLLYHGGAGVQHNPRLFVVFWGSNWGTSPGVEVRTQLLRFYEGLTGSAYQGILSQYFDSSGRISSSVSVTSYTDTSVTAPTSVNDTRIQAEVSSAISANGWRRDANAQFVVFTAPGSTYQSGFGTVPRRICGYHGVTTEGESSYTFVPYMGTEPFHAQCAAFDRNLNVGNVTSMLAAHEYAESATDPNPGIPTWEASNAGSEIYEVADICESGDDQLSNGSWVQGLWDDHQNACSLSDATPPHVYAITGHASEVTTTSAKLAGTINPEALETRYHFEYGTTTSYGTNAPVPDANGGSGTSNVEVTASIGGLHAGATYHYRLVATNSTGTTDGADSTFVAGLPVAPGTNPAVVRDASSGNQWVYYVDSNHEIAYWTYSGGTWTNRLAGGRVEAGTSPAVVRDATSGIQWVYYTNDRGGVSLLAFTGSSWSNEALGSSPNNVETGTSPIVVREAATGVQWVYYTNSSGGVSLWAFTGSAWSNGALGSSPNNVETGTSPIVVREAATGVQWVYYTNSSGGVSLWAFTGSAWSNGALGSSPNNVETGTSPIVVREAATGVQWVYYTNSSGGVSLWAFTGSAWVNEALGRTPNNVETGTSPTVVRDPTTGYQWVYYANSGGGLSAWSYNGSWTNSEV